MKKNIVVIGDYESVLIYKIFGWDIISIKKDDDIKQKLTDIIVSQNYSLVFLIEDIYKIFMKEKETFSPLVEKFKMSVIPLPGMKGTQNLGKEKYKELSRIATSISMEE